MRSRHKLLLMLAMVLLLTFLSATAWADTLRFGTVDGASTVNLRQGASTDTKKVGSYEKGTWLQVIGSSGNFYRVIGPDGRTGYMKKDFVYISAAAKGIIGIVDTNSTLNLRASASESGRVLGTYTDGTPCILLSETGNWYHVTVDGKAGYFKANFVNKKYMTYSSDVATVVSQNGGAVNLRKGPGKSYGTIRSVKNGAYVMIIQQGDDWWKVSVDGSVGFMDTNYLKDGIVKKGGTSSGGTSSGSMSSGSTSGSGYATVNNPGEGQKLFLRQSASRNSKVLGSYTNGVKVTVLDQGNVWCKVRVEGKTGYMMTKYLRFHGLAAWATAEVVHPDRTFVYLRSGPSQSTGKVLTKVPHGERVTILVPGSTWCQVRYDGKTGYMMTRFLED